MIKVFCDMCGKEIDGNENGFSMSVCCPRLTGGKTFIKHMHEGCAVCFLGADNVAAYERMQQEARETTAKAMQEMREAAEKAARAMRGTYNGDHDEDCEFAHPECICTRCKNDSFNCCYGVNDDCPIRHCPNFEPEETEGGKA